MSRTARIAGTIAVSAAPTEVDVPSGLLKVRCAVAHKPPGK
jgi:hypothetical protein